MEGEELALVEQIKGSLAELPIESWEVSGRVLNTEETFPKPRDSWERVYITKLPDASLLLRHSQSLSVKYEGSSYRYRHSGFPAYTIEIRAKEFNARELTEPGSRVKCQDDRLEVLADGETARKLFEYLDERYTEESRVKKQIFEKEVEQLISSLPEIIESQTLGEFWKREVNDFGTVIYRSFQGSFDLELSMRDNDGLDETELRISRSPFDHKEMDTPRVETIFELLEKSRKIKGLVAINEALSEVEAA